MDKAKQMRHLLWFLLFLYLVVFSFGQFNRLPLTFLPAEVKIYFTDILVGIIGIIGTCFWKAKKEFPFARPLFVFMVAAFFSLIVASVSLTASDTIASSLYLLRLVSYGLFFFTVWNLIKTNRENELILNSLIVIGVAIAVFGWIQYFLFPDLRALLTIGWDEHMNRVVGTFLDPNFTSIILVFTLILILGVEPLNGPIKWAVFSVVLIALLLTYSRSGYLAFVAAIIVYSIILKNIRIGILGAVLLIGGIFLLPKQTSEGTKLERTASLNLRMENLREGWELFQVHPVFGVGFNTLRYTREPQAEKYGPSHAASGFDNSFLFVLVTTGIVGFVAFINLLWQIIREVWSVEKMRAILIPSFAALAVHCLFVNSLFYPWVLGWLVLLLAAGLRPSEN